MWRHREGKEAVSHRDACYWGITSIPCLCESPGHNYHDALEMLGNACELADDASEMPVDAPKMVSDAPKM